MKFIHHLAAAAGLLLGACAPVAVLDPTDAPDPAHSRMTSFVPAASYAEALAKWRTADDLNAWIGARFEYDRARAMQLSETQRAKAGAAILAPAEFFASPRGVCVDLSRFAVETLRAIDPAAKPAFLMIEFEPVKIQGNTLRLHWLASYRRDGLYYFFADSKRPGDIAGPYPTIEAFIAEYELYRGRKVMRWRELESYERKQRVRASRQEHTPTRQDESVHAVE